MLLCLLRATSQQIAVSLYFFDTSIHKSELYVKDLQVSKTDPVVCGKGTNLMYVEFFIPQMVKLPLDKIIV